MKKTILLLLFLNLGISAFSNQPLVRNFTRSSYNAGTQNWAITQDEYNTMYFANNFGLLEFDGKKWSTFPIKNGTNVRSILYTKNGRIYAATFNEFGFYQQLKNGQFEYHSLMNKLAKNSINSNELYNILQGDKKIYFQAGKSIYQYTGDTITSYSLRDKIDIAAYVHNILFVASSQQGIFMLNGKILVRMSGSELLINKKVCSILPFKDNKILFITSFNGVFLFDGVSIVPYNTGIDEFLKKNQVFCAATNGKQLVFGTVQN